MAGRSALSNPLALAVLGALIMRPMHPYEIATQLKDQHKHESVRLNYGSLYTVVDALERAGLVETRETVRDGRRPERTVYAITDDGRAKFSGWLCSLLADPVKEYPQFAAGLSFALALTADELSALLRQRIARLEDQAAAQHAQLALATAQGVPRAALIELEFVESQCDAELSWTRGLVRELAEGTLPWPSFEVVDGRLRWSLPGSFAVDTGPAGPLSGEVAGATRRATDAAGRAEWRRAKAEWREARLQVKSQVKGWALAETQAIASRVVERARLLALDWVADRLPSSGATPGTDPGTVTDPVTGTRPTPARAPGHSPGKEGAETADPMSP